MTDARALLDAGPDGYVERRKQVAAELTKAGDKARAATVKKLAKPTLTLWAALAAAARAPDHVRAAVEATEHLAQVQGGGADAASVRSATDARRKAIDAVVDDAGAALAELGRAASTTLSGRRDEIRALVDRLTRDRANLDAWLDGTLRDVPEGEIGFAGFGDVVVPDRPARERPAPKEQAAPPARHREEAPERPRVTAVDEARARKLAAAEERHGEAKEALASARQELAAARRAERDAQSALDAATRALARAEAAVRTAEGKEHHAAAELARRRVTRRAE